MSGQHEWAAINGLALRYGADLEGSYEWAAINGLALGCGA